MKTTTEDIDMQDEAKMQEQKDAVAAMKHAQANMTKALDRISKLEYALERCAKHLETAAGYFPNAYDFRSEKRLSEVYKGYAAEARKVL